MRTWRGVMAVDINELRAYLDPRLEALEKTIRNITEPILKDVDRLREDINDLYEKDRSMRDRIGLVESGLNTLKDDKEDKKHSSQNVILIITIVVTGAIALIGWIR